MRTKRLFLTSVLLLTCAISNGNASEGQHVGNGGEPTVQAFVRSAKQGIQVLAGKSKQLPWLDMATVRNTLQNAKIEATHETLYERKGLSRAAINIPEEQLIRINIDQWNRIRSTEKIIALALHEVLSLANYEGMDYRVTSWLFDLTPLEIENDVLANLRTGLYGTEANRERIQVTHVDLDNRMVYLMHGSNSIRLNCQVDPSISWRNQEGFCEGENYFFGTREFWRLTVHETGNFALYSTVYREEQIEIGTWYHYELLTMGPTQQSQR